MNCQAPSLFYCSEHSRVDSKLMGEYLNRSMCRAPSLRSGARRGKITFISLQRV
jgi:hypothetical protein